MSCTLPVLLLALSSAPEAKEPASKAPATPEPRAPTASVVISKWFPQLEGWKLSAAPTQYTPENLFEYIDGGADAFLQFDFEELLTASYVNAQKVEVTVDLYHHRNATRAFGMYTQERPAGSSPLSVGIEGNAGPDHLEFVAGPVYVKLAQAGGKNTPFLRLFADNIAARLPGTRESPAVLKCFPDKGKRPRAEKLAARDFLGHAFLHDAAVVPYQIDGAKFRLFAIEGKDESDARTMVQRYSVAAKYPAGQHTGQQTGEIEKAGSATLKDPLNGEVLLRWDGRWLWGAVDQPSTHWQAVQALTAELGRNLQSGRK
ncbi:MAG TPA: DUF6599 family protein [Polyangia bacterium]